MGSQAPRERLLKDLPQRDDHFVQKLADFIRNADVLITDATYTDEEYEKKVGWGHSCLSEVTDLAARASVAKLCLFHHDHNQDDADIDRKLEIAQQQLADKGADTTCLAPAEGDVLRV